MGIKGLKGWLAAHCKSAFASSQMFSEALFVDLAAITSKYYRVSGCLKDGVASEQFYDCIISEILEIVRQNRVSRVVYIGKDGLEMPAKEWERATRARQEPKRQTKSVSMYFPDTKESFDRNMRAAIRRQRKVDAWKDFDVVYDPAEAPKAAAQKFIDNLQISEKSRKMHWLIVSDDTDFILLALAQRLSKLRIALGDAKKCDIGALRTAIAKFGDETDECVDDFVFLMSMVENDFLPGIASIGALVKAYRRISQHLVTDGHINIHALKELWKNLGARPIGQVNARQRSMAECYIHGLHWFANLYFGVWADWSWFYPFQENPSLQSLLTFLEDLVVPVPEVLKPVPMKVHYLEARAEATDEQVIAAFQKVFRNSLNNVLAKRPDLRMSEIKVRVYNDERTMDALVAMLELSDDAADIPATPGVLWVYEGTNEQRVILDMLQPLNAQQPTGAHRKEVRRREFVNFDTTPDVRRRTEKARRRRCDKLLGWIIVLGVIVLYLFLSDGGPEQK